MRSSTDSTLTGRCPRCWIRRAHCVCADVPRVEPAHELVVVRHRQEAWKSTNTARIAALALPRLAIVEFGEDVAAARQAVEPFLAHDAVLVYPGATSPEEAPGPPRGRLVFLDGTWRQTRRMLKKLPALAALPRLALPPKETTVVRLRQPTFEGGRSTLEAIADALRAAGDTPTAARLDALHALYVEHVLRARGRREQSATG